MAEKIGVTDEIILQVMKNIPHRPFHTSHFIEGLQIAYPKVWDRLVKLYGRGGRGAGTHYSANSAVSQALNRAAGQEILDKLEEYGKAPPDLNWGNPFIRYWTDAGGFRSQVFPDEVPLENSGTYPEGTVVVVKVNRYERSPAARAACISYHGATCKACGIDFGKRYRKRGENFIHVHHLLPLHRISKGYEVDPVSQLVPVCPNCHAMIHREDPMLSIEELRALLLPP